MISDNYYSYAYKLQNLLEWHTNHYFIVCSTWLLSSSCLGWLSSDCTSDWPVGTVNKVKLWKSSNQNFLSIEYLDPGLKWLYMLYDSDLRIFLIIFKELMLLSLISAHLVAYVYNCPLNCPQLVMRCTAKLVCMQTRLLISYLLCAVPVEYTWLL